MVAAVAIDEPQMAPKPAQAHDRRHREPAAQMADESVGRAKQLLRHAGAGDEVAHQDEQRHHRQRVIAPGLVDLGLDHRHGRREIPVAQIGDAEEADDSHRDRDRNAQQRKHHHQAEADQGFGHVGLTLSGSNALRFVGGGQKRLDDVDDGGDQQPSAP